MRGIQPSSLSDEELLRYASLERPEHLPPAWVTELIRRLAAHVDAKTTDA
jgi:hypothetical protein